MPHFQRTNNISDTYLIFFSSLSASVGILHLLSHLYVQRSFSLWKEHAEWFTSAITEAFTTLPTSLPVTERRKSFLAQYQSTNLRYSVYRHIMVLETSYKRLFSFIPRVVLEAKSLACDPLPPPTSVNQYDQDFFQGIDDLYSPRIRSRRQRANDERRLAQFIPDAAFRQQLQVRFLLACFRSSLSSDLVFICILGIFRCPPPLRGTFPGRHIPVCANGWTAAA